MMSQPNGDNYRSHLDAIVASETNRLVLRDANRRQPPSRPSFPHAPVASPRIAAVSTKSAAETLAPGIVGAVAFFIVMFALVAAYWRCGRRGESEQRRRIRRQRMAEPMETESGGCRITVNPLEDEIEMKPRSTGTTQSLDQRKKFKKTTNDTADNQLDGDFDDLASLLSSSSSSGSSCDSSDEDCNEVDENCEQCRREARLASPESEDDEEQAEDEDDCCFDASNYNGDIGFADEDDDEQEDEAAQFESPDAERAGESVKLIRHGAC